MKIYAYYQSIPTSNQDEQFACANMWKTSWSYHGWEPVMLNRSHAMVSSKYNKVLQKLVGSLRHIDAVRNQFDFIVARFVRWCALHASGGGWMSDYDVLNTGFTTEAAKALKDTMLLSSGPAHLFYVSEENAQNVINKYLIEDILNGSTVRFECDILGIQPMEFDGVFHAKSSKECSKSALMNNVWNSKFAEKQEIDL